MRHNFQMRINIESVQESSPAYEADYAFGNDVYTIKVYPAGVIIDGKVYIRKQDDSEDIWWSPSKGCTKKSFYDAVRKAYLLYAFSFGKGLEIKTIDSYCDGAWIKTMRLGYGAFPFVYSMLEDEDLNLQPYEPNSTGILGNKAIMDHIAESNRSTDQEDKKMIALYAYLQSKTRLYEGDRFLNLWTGINALYGFLRTTHAECVEKKIDELFENNEGVSIPDRKQIEDAYTAPDRNDSEQKKFMLKVVQEMSAKYSGFGKLPKYKKGKSDMTEAMAAISNDYNDYYGPFIEKTVKNESKKGIRIQYNYSLDGLYQRIRGVEPGEIPGWDEEKEKKYQQMTEMMQKNAGALAPYYILTFELPYYQRNFFIHGGETSLLLTDDYHINKVTCMNYFMDRFLAEFIPYLFDSEKLNEMIHYYHTAVYNSRKDGNSNEKNPERRAKAAQYKNTIGELRNAGLKNANWVNGVMGE